MKRNKYENKVDEELDLHGEYVEQGIETLKEFLASARARGCKNARVITGKGLHSQTGEALLREAVINYLTDRYIWKYEKSPIGPNTGAIIVKIR